MIRHAPPRGTDDELVAVCARVPEHELIAAECQALTGGVPDEDGVAPCTSIDRIERAAFIQTGLRTIAGGATFEELVEAVANTDFDADRFRIDLHDPSSRLGRTTQEVAIALADVIPYGPDLRDPQQRFLVIAAKGWIRLGLIEKRSDSRYRTHEKKPWTTSSSLDPRLSRALVNLVPNAQSILDPCCGAGSILLEAASLGLTAIGVDWKPAMVGMTSINLAHFGYQAHVERADSRHIGHYADAIVTDLPYGHALDSDERTTRGILERGAELAPSAVYVAPHDITDWLTVAGYGDVEVHAVVKRRGFTRWIHVAQRAIGRAPHDTPERRWWKTGLIEPTHALGPPGPRWTRPALRALHGNPVGHPAVGRCDAGLVRLKSPRRRASTNTSHQK
jgi:predicted RNA methylase